MTYTPVELRHVRVARRPFGYDRAAVEQILSDVADSFETVWRDRGELADRVEELEQALEQAKQREQLLTNTLVAAERAAEEMRDRARREAELIVSEAHAEARSVMHQSQAERERLLAEVRRIEILLRSALGIVGDAAVSSEQPAASRRRSRATCTRSPPRRPRRRRPGPSRSPTRRPWRRRTSCPAGRRCGGSLRAARTSTGAMSLGTRVDWRRDGVDPTAAARLAGSFARGGRRAPRRRMEGARHRRLPRAAAPTRQSSGSWPTRWHCRSGTSPSSPVTAPATRSSSLDGIDPEEAERRLEDAAATQEVRS